MSANKVRLQAITDVEAYVPPAVTFDPGEEPGEIFGANVFSLSVMQKLSLIHISEPTRPY